MKKWYFLIFMVSSITLNAQKGTIRGTVIEDETGLTVIGANVVITEPLTGVSTDLDGNFSIEIAPGTYQMQVSFISFQKLTIQDVVVKEGEVTQVGTIRMKPSSLQLNEVVISATATRKSEAALNTMKKKSVAMLDGISAQKMAMTGDGSAAEAAKRVTGVSIEGGKYIYVRGLGDRYSKVTLNGVDIPGLDPDRNTLQMDIFPTSLIDNITVSKNFTADLPADFTGGLMNIETKEFPDEKLISASFGITYNPSMHFNSDYINYDGGNTDFLGFDDGTRYLPSNARNNDLIPQRFVNSDQEINQFVKEFDPQLGAKNETSLLDYSLSFTIADQLDLKSKKDNSNKSKGKLGYIFSLSYKSEYKYFDDVTYAEFQRQIAPTDKELIFSDKQEGVLGEKTALVGALGGIAYKTKLSKFKFTIMRLQNGESRAAQFNLIQNASAVGRSGFEAFSNNLEYNERSLTNFFLGGKTVIDKKGWEIDWRISPTFSVADDPNIRKAAFTIGEVDTSFQSGNAGFPSMIWRELSEFNFSNRIDLTKKYKLFNEDAKLKFGAAFTYKDRDYEILSYDIQFNGRQIWNGLDPNQVFQSKDIFPNGSQSFISSRNNNPNPNQYEADLRNIAFYVSNEFSLNSNLKAVAGIRVEDFQQNHTGRDIDGANNNGGNVLNDDVVLESVDFFPTLNLIYAIAEEQNLRFAYARTIARPSFKELSFAQILDPVTNRTFNGSLFEFSDWDGNLISTDIDNIDFRWEKFMEGGQIFSVSSFYKRFNNPIELVRIPVVNTGFEYQPRNVGDGQLFGIELEATKNLSFIAKKFSNFGISGNLTIVHSIIDMTESEFNSRVENSKEGETIDTEREMAGQAPVVINLGITYSNLETGIRSGLFFNAKGKTLIIVGTGFIPDIYQEPFYSLNWGISKTIGEGDKTSIDFKVANILNDKRESFFESDGSIDSDFEFGKIISDNFTKSFSSSDQIFNSINPGVSFSIGISHKF